MHNLAAASAVLSPCNFVSTSASRSGAGKDDSRDDALRYLMSMSNGLLTAAQRPVPLIRRNDVDVSRITRIRQMLDQRIAKGEKLTIETMEQLQQDAYSLRAERDAPLFKGWTAKNADAERARAMIDGWDHVLTRDTVPGAIYVRWSTSEAGRKAVGAKGAERVALVEAGLLQAIERASKDWGADWTQWRYGRINESTLPHMFVDATG